MLAWLLPTHVTTTTTTTMTTTATCPVYGPPTRRHTSASWDPAGCLGKEAVVVQSREEVVQMRMVLTRQETPFIYRESGWGERGAGEGGRGRRGHQGCHVDASLNSARRLDRSSLGPVGHSQT